MDDLQDYIVLCGKCDVRFSTILSFVVYRNNTHIDDAIEFDLRKLKKKKIDPFSIDRNHILKVTSCCILCFERLLYYFCVRPFSKKSTRITSTLHPSTLLDSCFFVFKQVGHTIDLPVMMSSQRASEKLT